MNGLSRPALLMALGALLSACAGTLEPPDTGADPRAMWELQKAANAGLESWNVDGRIGVKTGARGGSATLKWRYLPGAQDIELYGPFGGGRVRISADEHSAHLRDSRGRVITGRSPREVLYKRLGWQVPINDLVLWSRGLHHPSATDVRIDGAGRLKSMNQGVWRVEYQEYRQVGGLVLPRKLTITSLPGKMELYDDEGNYIGDELSVKVILKRWSDIVAG